MVNVAEPLKIARMIAGLNQLRGGLQTPFPVGGIRQIQIRNWAIEVEGKLQYRDVDITLAE